VSRLYYSESGRTVLCMNEELTRQRRARKLLYLPERVASGGTLYVYARRHPGCRTALRLSVNGSQFQIPPDGSRHLRWFALPLQGADLRGGENTIELWADSAAMDGWVLGLEGNPSATDSALSLDGGRTWQNRHMGHRHRLRGEYVVRLRLADESLSDPPAPGPIWEARDCPLFEELRGVVPREISAVGDPWERARALCSWVAAQWVYRNADGGTEYAPWDALTILSWGRNAHGQELPDPIVMCAHYAVVFAAAALALGIPARNVCATDAMGSQNGHFVSEVWIEKWLKWCQVDANCDVVYVKDGVPLGVSELHPAGEKLPALAVKGPGFDKQTPHVQRAAEEYFITGRSFALWAVWPRNDYLSHPEQTPTSHGAGGYHETDWLWARTPTSEDLGMFPHRVEGDSLQIAPPDEWRAPE